MAIGEGYLDHNPATKVKLYSERNVVKERILSEEEEARLMEESYPTLRSILSVMLNAGGFGYFFSDAWYSPTTFIYGPSAQAAKPT